MGKCRRRGVEMKARAYRQSKRGYSRNFRYTGHKDKSTIPTGWSDALDESTRFVLKRYFASFEQSAEVCFSFHLQWLHVLQCSVGLFLSCPSSASTFHLFSMDLFAFISVYSVRKRMCGINSIDGVPFSPPSSLSICICKS